MEANERNQLLARLYALRAGLSVVSEKKDDVTYKLEKRDREKQKLLEEEAVQTQKAHDLQQELKLQFLKKEEVWKRSDISPFDLLSGMRDYKKYSEKRLRRYRRLWKVFIYLAAVSLILAAVFSVCYVAVAPGFLWGIIGGGLAFLLCLLLVWRSKHWERFEMKEIKEYEGKIKEKESDIAKKREQLTAVNERISAIPSEWDTMLSNANMSVEADIGECDALYASLRSNFSSLLDERDWKNIDLVIFYFETGRADTLKEALQQVDREMQTDRIVGAIKSAGTLISQTIRGGLSALHADMVKCFSLLSAQIDEANKRQYAAIGNLSEQLKGLSAQVEKIDFSRSLAVKASVPSQQLVQDLHYMRTLAENAEIRRRNGLN